MSTRFQTVFPIVVKQILQNKSQDFRLYGKSIDIAVLVGRISNIHQDNLQITFFVTDHTGRIKCLLLLDSSSQYSLKFLNVKEKCNVQVFGKASVQDAVKTFSVAKVVGVDDCNVLLSHLLQVVYAKVDAAAELRRTMSSANTMGAALIQELTFPDLANDSRQGFSTLEDTIIGIVKADSFDEFGVTRQSILRQFPAYQIAEVEQSLQHLVNEGVLYPTIDANHFKTTA